jgi:Trypsin-co-occurring domain 1
MASQVVTYRLDESTLVRFEVEPPEGFHPAGPDQIAGRVREAIGPAVEAAKTVLEKVKEIAPDQVELKFGVKVSGGAQWLVAKAAAEGNFEITLSWHPRTRDTEGPGAGKA